MQNVSGAKTIFMALAFFLIASGRLLAQGQTGTEAQTLFGGNGLRTKDLGFFVAPAIGFTQMDGAAATLFQLRGGINLKDRFTVGGYFNHSLNDIRPKSETVPGVYMDYWSAGGFTEYTVLAKKLFHLTLPLFIGYGEVEMDNEMGRAGLGEANFLQVEPSALLEINLHRYARFNVGVGYRMVGQMSYRNFDQRDISGLTGYVGLKFGLFR